MHTRSLSTTLGVLFLVSTTSAQTTAAAHAFGYGCPSCFQINEDTQTNAAKTLRIQSLPNEYSYGFTATTNMRIVGFAMSPLSAALAVKWLIGYLGRHGLALFGWYRLILTALLGALIWLEVVAVGG